MTLTYFAQATFDGRWTPCTTPTEPLVKHGRLKKVGGQGPRVRRIVKVEPFLGHLTLDQLRAVYSPDGHLQATRRKP